MQLAHAEESIDLLIADFRMPETSGIGLASRLREYRPVGAIADALDFLSKPFTRDQLVDAVREVLQRNRGGSPDSPVPLEQFIL